MYCVEFIEGIVPNICLYKIISPITGSLYCYHSNRNVILIKFSSLPALKVVKMTTFSAASDENFIKMMTFPSHCTRCITLTSQACFFVFLMHYESSRRRDFSFHQSPNDLCCWSSILHASMQSYYLVPRNFDVILQCYIKGIAPTILSNFLGKYTQIPLYGRLESHLTASHARWLISRVPILQTFLNAFPWNENQGIFYFDSAEIWSWRST